MSRKAAGELCMQFYDIEGHTGPYASDNAVIGMDIHRLCKVPCSVGIAGGKRSCRQFRVRSMENISMC